MHYDGPTAFPSPLAGEDAESYNVKSPTPVFWLRSVFPEPDFQKCMSAMEKTVDRLCSVTRRPPVPAFWQASSVRLEASQPTFVDVSPLRAQRRNTLCFEVSELLCTCYVRYRTEMQ